MFKHKLLIIFSAFFLVVQCDNSTMHSSDIALKLKKLENNGTVSQSDRKDSFLLFIEQDLFSTFTEMGFGHRIQEIKENWNIYEDKEFVIITGSVAKEDNDIYMFTIVLEDADSGKFHSKYIQIGSDISGTYPRNIIPD